MEILQWNCFIFLFILDVLDWFQGFVRFLASSSLDCRFGLFIFSGFNLDNFGRTLFDGPNVFDLVYWVSLTAVGGSVAIELNISCHLFVLMQLVFLWISRSEGIHFFEFVHTPYIMSTVGLRLVFEVLLHVLGFSSMWDYLWID